MTNFDQAMLTDLFRQAKASPRLRSHLLLHGSHDEPVQRMVIALHTGTYFRVHRHPEQWELMTLLRGRMDYLLFAPDGRVGERIVLAAGRSSVLQLPPGQVHGVVVMEDDTATLEVKPGPFRPMVFEDWSPEEGSPDAPAFLDWATRAQAGERWPPRG